MSAPSLSTSAAPRPLTSSSSTTEPASDAPPAEHYEASLRRRLAFVASLTAQASDGALAPLARREAARLATSTLGAAAAVHGAWLDELRFEGVDLCDWGAQAAVDLGDTLARARAALSSVVATLPVAPAPLARTAAPAPASRRAGGAA